MKVVAGAACLAVFALVAGSPYVDVYGGLHQLDPIIAAVFMATGWWARRRRPDQRTGALMIAIGVAWLPAGLIAAQPPLLFMIGWILLPLPYVLIIGLLLAFPDGHIERRRERWLLLAALVIVMGPQIPEALVFRPEGPRANPFLVSADRGLLDALDSVQAIGGIVTLLIAGALLAARYRAAEHEQRHALQPVLAAGLLLVTTLVITLVADLTDLSETAERATDVTGRLTILCVPLLFLAGLLRGRLSRAMAVAALAEQLERGTLQEAIGAALGDPTLRLAYASGDGFVDEDGVPVGDLGAHTPVERDGRTVGALLHDPVLATEEPEALRSAAAAAGLAMENARLQAEQTRALRASRARLVAAGDAERRRLERDLHDGAQQRLVSLALTLRLARNRADGELADLLAGAAAELQQATTELRELARGIHPAVLTDQGLGPALSALAGRAGVAVELAELPESRLPPAVEATAYFVVAEALTNVARYARASAATVSVARVDGHVTVEVADDGVGGARVGGSGSGSGLRGLADRVAALDGELAVDSPPGAGTRIRAELPCGS